MPQCLKMLKCFLACGTAACKAFPRFSELYYSGFFPTWWVGVLAAQDLPQEKKGFFPDVFFFEQKHTEGKPNANVEKEIFFYESHRERRTVIT